jgi:hypothetical protein
MAIVSAACAAPGIDSVSDIDNATTAAVHSLIGGKIMMDSPCNACRR